MSQTTRKTGLQIPDRMRSKLEQFQRRIWIVKLAEGVCAAVFGLLMSFLVVFALDRFFDLSSVMRTGILIGGSLGLAIWLPWVCHRWIWKSRRLEQVARMLKHKHPRLGDYLLGIIELVNNETFEGTSETLCRAALAQADRETAERDFTDAVPFAKHRRWALIAAIPLAVAVVGFLLVPAAGSNAFQRWLMPWKNIDRYTFTQVETLPKQVIVPISEQTELDARFSKASRWNPNSGSVWVGQHRVDSRQENGEFKFGLPPLKSLTNVNLRIGDVIEQVEINPQPRPELASLAALIQLPDYLQRSEPIRREIRGGALSIVQGSHVSIEATATRSLASATVNGESISVAGESILTAPTLLRESQTLELAWKDGLGLTAKSPLKLKMRSAEDESPALNCRELERQRVIMEKDLLAFEVDASDDFGIKTIGMEWSGKPAPTSAAKAAQGEKIVLAGNPQATDVTSISATFSPRRLSIEPQTIQLRLFVEDYHPDRERVYSPVYSIIVLSEDEHAIWMTRRLDDWFKQSLETYEQEQQLYKRNVQLRNLPPAELDRPENRRRIESQAAAERAQSRRLEALTDAGEMLVKEAARNENFGVDHLEKLAEMIQSLNDIYENQMPSVSDLLKKAAESAASAEPAQPASQQTAKSVSDNPSNPGQQTAANSTADDEGEKKKLPPSIAINESNMNAANEEEKENNEESPPSAGSPKFTLPTVNVAALPDDGNQPPAACPAGQKMEQAVDAQEELLAEFQKVAEELQKLIANLEGSTFVKRLKAMSRRELVMAKDVNRSTLVGFGSSQSKLKDATRDRTKLLADRQKAHAQSMQHIEDDLEAYANRIQEGKFKTVLAEMRDLDTVKQVSLVADRMVANEPGTSIAHAELLADTFDRWAEQLVGPG